MKHDSLNLTAPHTLRELAQAETEAGAMHAKQIAAMIAEDACLDGQFAENAKNSGQPVTLTYRNWRGEVSKRTIVPGKVWFGSTDWHPEPQWLLTAFDVEKGADRDFALKDFGNGVRCYAVASLASSEQGLTMSLTTVPAANKAEAFCAAVKANEHHAPHLKFYGYLASEVVAQIGGSA